MQILGYLALAVLALLLVMQWRMRVKARRQAGQPLPPIDAELAERLRTRGKALLYFFSPSCGPCRAMTPVVDRLAAEHDNVFKIDVSREMETARKFQVMATPTVVAVTGTRIESVHLGALSEQAMRKLLEAE